MIKQLKTIRFHALLICLAVLFAACAEDRALKESQAQANRNLGLAYTLTRDNSKLL
jgi:hypothetical protein